MKTKDKIARGRFLIEVEKKYYFLSNDATLVKIKEAFLRCKKGHDEKEIKFTDIIETETNI